MRLEGTIYHHSNHCQLPSIGDKHETFGRKVTQPLFSTEGFSRNCQKKTRKTNELLFNMKPEHNSQPDPQTAAL